VLIAGGRFPKLPRDAVWGAGAGDQHLIVVPSLKLIAVRNGAALGAPWFELLAAAVTNR
jgi:hypothetical protein